MAAVAGCDSLLDVELPGRLVATDLDNPDLAETLVRSVQGDFECAFRGYLVRDAIWGDVANYHGTFLNWLRTEQRAINTREGGNQECESIREPVWLPMHITRNQADNAIEIIQGFEEGAVEDPDFLIGKAYLYKGYATEMLSEHYCGMVFEGGGEQKSRDEGFQRASELFTSAIDFAGRSSNDEADDVVNFALVGRARAKLNLGDGTGAVNDAEQVDAGFVGYATYEEGGDLRREWNAQVPNLNEDATIQGDFADLEVEGTPDPRVPLLDMGETPQYGVPFRVQAKYPSPGSDIPIASWREAQLIIAEVEGGATAVGIINDLRDTVSDLPWVDDSHPGLPHFNSTDEDEILAQVIEERRRELFLQGTQVGDDLRTGEWENWDKGFTIAGLPIDPEGSCMPVPLADIAQ